MVKPITSATVAIDDVEYHRAVAQVEAEQRKAADALLVRIKART